METYRRKDELPACSAGITSGLIALQRVTPVDAAADGAGAMQLVPGRRANVVREPAHVHGVVKHWRKVAFEVVFRREHSDELWVQEGVKQKTNCDETTTTTLVSAEWERVGAKALRETSQERLALSIW